MSGVFRIETIDEKVLNSWVFFTAAFAIAVFLGAFIIGKERLNALGWPFTKIFK